MNIDWNAVSSLATLMLAFATFIMVALSFLAIRITSKAEKDKYKPYVYFDIVVEKMYVWASIKNIGKSPAYDICITISPEITQDIRGEDYKCVLQNDCCSTLNPGREVRDFIGHSVAFYQRYANPVFIGTIKYKDQNGKETLEKININLSSFKGLVSIGES